MLLYCKFILAQVGIGTVSPRGALEIRATNDGLLIPRVALTATNVATILTPTTSELVFNTATSAVGPNQVTPGFYFWDGSSWAKIITSNLPVTNWSTSGNTATNANFIGTTNDQDLIFKRNNVISGYLNFENTVFGVNSLPRTSDAEYATVFGANALRSNVSSLGNTAIGYQALEFTTTGGVNTAVGGSSLRNNTTGYANCSIGILSMLQNTIGYQNSAFGTSALLSNTGGYRNTATGFESLRANTTGISNSAFGERSLNKSTTAILNVAMGSRAMFNTTSGSRNTAIGGLSLNLNTTGEYNTAIGYNALNNNTTGSNNTAIGFGAAIPNNTANNQVRIGNTSITYAGIQVAWSVTSDRRWKTNIEKSNLGLDFISKLNPVSYNRNNDEKPTREYGFIAQELEKTLRVSGAANTGIISKDDAGMYSVRYNDLLAPMVKAIQELEEKNRKQEQLINQLMTKFELLEKQLQTTKL
jgi:trimeric autotransporter adhesin